MRQDNPEWDSAMRDRVGLVAAFTRTPRVGSPSSPPEVVGIEVDRQLSGDVPDGVRLVGGSSTATAKITLDSLTPRVPNVLNVSDLSDWIGSRVQLVTGFAGHALPIHTGAVRSLSASDATHLTTVEVLDGSDALRATVTLPAFGSVAKRWATGQSARFPLNASAVVVAALHACGIRVTPPPRPEAVASIPLVFGPVPDPGFGWLVPNQNWFWGDPQSDGVPKSAPACLSSDGRWGPRVNATADTMPLIVHPNTHAGFGLDCTYYAADCWIYTGTSDYEAVELDFGISFSAMIKPGMGVIRLQTMESDTWTIRGTVSVSIGWHHVRLTARAGVGVTMNVDNSDVASSYSYAVPANHGSVRVYLANPCWVQALQVLKSDSPISADWAGDAAFTPQADISISALDLDYLPAVSSVVAWTLIKTIASAEFAMAGFDEAGRFHYRTRAEVNAKTVPAMDFSGDVLPDVQGSAVVDSVRTVLEMSVRPRALIESGFGWESEATTSSAAAVADSVWTVPQGWSSHEIHASNPWHGSLEDVVGITQANMAWMQPSGMVLCQNPDGTGSIYAAANGSDVTIHAFLVMTGPTSGLIWIYNNSGGTRYAVWPSTWTEAASGGKLPYGLTPGGPAVWILGRALTGDDPESVTTIEDSDAVAAWGTRTLSMDSSDWRQYNQTLNDLGAAILSDLAAPRLALSDITIPGDPRLELGDVVRIQGQARFSDIHARITRIQTKAGSGVIDQGLVTTLGLRVIDPQIAAPIVHDVYPDAGPSAGGTTVIISGANLAGVTAVRFGGALATDLVATDQVITCTTPTNNVGDVQVTVGSAGGLASWVQPWRVGGTPSRSEAELVAQFATEAAYMTAFSTEQEKLTKEYP